jgi:hypothetical protein
MPNEPFSRIGDIKVYRSNWVPKGKLIVLGTSIMSRPEDWNSMTKDEQLVWAIAHGHSILINERERIYAERV